MARFFISYSRSIKDDVHKIINLLRASGHDVWWDGDIPIMADWWATILDHIEWCDIFVFIASEKSVESPYCLAELRYANERGRLILPLIWESPDTFSLPAELPHRNQWLIFDGDPVTMLGQINTAYGLIDGNYPQDIEAQRPPEPNTGETSIIKQYQEALKLAYAMDFEGAKRILRNLKRLDPKGWGQDCDKWLAQINAYTPLVELVDHESTYGRASQGWLAYVRQYGLEFDPYQIEQRLKRPQSASKLPIISIISALVIVAVLTLAYVIATSDNGQDDPLNISTDEPTLIAQLDSDQQPSQTPTLTETLTEEAPPSITPSPTTMPTELSIPLIVGTLDAQATIEQATANAEATISQRATDYAQMTQESVNQTATATQWTNTPTPDITASIVAFRTEQAATVTQAWVDSWTPTPTNTHTPSPTPNVTATLIAFRPQTNPDWTPIEREFDGVPMVLVPVGCFMMGSDRYDDEKPVHEQCFDEPFWIDQYEVTQAQFVSFGGVKANDNRFTGDNRPVERITWFEARDFCELRGGRLPTEAEWEYAARGVDGLIYPWGNEWNENNAVWNRSSEQGTTDVGSIPDGKSWIGAYDMSGNVWEWISSLYESYPYDRSDGREQDTGDSTDVRRVLRGGSWYGNGSNFLRAPDRYRGLPNSRDYYFGVRCVLPTG